MIENLRWLWNRLGVWFLPGKPRPYHKEALEAKLERERIEENSAQFNRDDKAERERQLYQDFGNEGVDDQPVVPFLKEPEGASERESRSSSSKKSE